MAKGVLQLKLNEINVNYFIDGERIAIPTKIYYKKTVDEFEDLEYTHLEVEINNIHYKTKPTDVTEIAVMNLQKQLPANISIACCQSCIHGNFCPYGDQDDQIFCFKDLRPQSKNDVVDVFSEQDESLFARARNLLHFCSDYKPIVDDQYYTYNDWYFYIKKD